jgi:type VI secretion system secreted protein Hcp
MALFDAFLKIDGIDGESQDSKHKGEIEILSFAGGLHNQSQAAGSGGHGKGKVSFQDIQIVKHMDKSSPKLMLACASGQHIKKMTLTCRKAGGDQQQFLSYILSDVLVSSYQTGVHGEGDNLIPTDQFSLNFSKIEYEVKEQKPDGTVGGPVKSGWDLKQNVKA